MLNLRPLLLLLALGTVGFVGCDSTDDGEPTGVLGRWEALDTPNDPDLYLNISEDEIVAHFFADELSCFVRESFDVIERDGNEWTLRYEDGETEVGIFRLDGDELVIEDPSIEDGDIVRFERSSRTEFTPRCN